MAGEEIPMMFFAQWYKEDVKKHLTRKQKEALLKRISDVSLRQPIFFPGVDFDPKDFPELAPYMHDKKLSGLQLYAVMTEIFNELNPKMGKKLGKPYPDFPQKRLRKVS